MEQTTNDNGLLISFYSKEIYRLATDLWFLVADDRMSRCGHPGIEGNPSDKPFNLQYGQLKGAIGALKEVADKINTY